MPVNDLAAELLETSFAEDPIAASLLGIPGYDDKLPDFSRASEQTRVFRLSSIVKRAMEIPSSSLEELERQTLDFVRLTASAASDMAAIPRIEWTIGDFQAAPVAGVLAFLPKVALDTDARRAGYLDRLKGLPHMLVTASQRHSDGIRSGRLPVVHLVRAAIAQLDLILSDPMVGGLRKHDGQAGEPFTKDIERLLDDAVRPALISYRDTLWDLLESGRDDAHSGLLWLPDGRPMYESLVRAHTSSNLSPDELHSIGLELVAQITSEFSEIGARLWNTATRDEIFGRLRHDPELRYTSAREMLDVARRAVGRAEGVAHQWFGIVPNEECQVEAVSKGEEAGSAAAYYIPGAMDGSRRGTYFLNTSKPGERFRHLAEAVAFHEAVPGHHFQLTIALQQEGLPLARRVMMDTACAEGWGLYAERLADEMGLYSDDLARLGMLSADAWRAGRLVIDTGLHHLGWGRQKAIDWMHEHTPLGATEIEVEIDRYITYPGQAVSYMVGRLELSRLRRNASSRLGASFDLRAFHDLILRVGAMPLPALASALERWIVGVATEG